MKNWKKMRNAILIFYDTIVKYLYNAIATASVARAVSLSFAIAIFVGAILLKSTGNGEKFTFVNSLYLSASAFCVTGLSPINISELNIYAQVLLLIYIQMGGLGIIVFTAFIGSLIIRGLSRNTALNELVKQVLDTEVEDDKTAQESGSIWRLLIAILNITVTIEILGALALYYTFPSDIPKNASRAFLSIFTSISAFNNAGFSIVDSLEFSMKNQLSLYIISLLIVLGGIGYPVIIFLEKLLLQILHKFISRFEVLGETHLMTKAIKGEEPSSIYLLFTKLSLWTEYRVEAYNKSLSGESSKAQTNIILYGSLILVFTGTILLLLLELNNPKTIGDLSFPEKFANSLLTSVAARTAGFNTYDIAQIRDPSIVLLIAMMFIGGGPQGTAGGIKITTFAILIVYLGNVINSGNRIKIFGSTISKRSVAMSIRLFFLATTALTFVVFLLSMLHPADKQLTKIVFEVISAFGTVGFSLGFTPTISDIEKIVYALIMFVGRIGIFTVLIAITGNPVTSQMGSEDDGLKIQVG